MVKEHHLWLPSMPRLSYFINKVPGLSHPGMLEASPSSVLSFVSFSCARGERAFKNTATFPAPCLWLHQHIELVPNRPSSKMLLLGPAEMPAKLKTTTFTCGKQNSLHQTAWTYVLPTAESKQVCHTHGLFQGCCMHHTFGVQLKEMFLWETTAKNQLSDELFPLSQLQQTLLASFKNTRNLRKTESNAPPKVSL